MQYQRFNSKLRWLGTLLDAAHSVASVFRSFHRPLIPLSAITPRKVLVVESHLIGDTVLLIPVLEALKRKFGSSTEIHVLGNPWIRDVLNELRLADRLIVQKIPWATYDYSPKTLQTLLRTINLLREEHYDLAIDPRGDARNCVLLWATSAGRRLGFGVTGGVRYLTDVADPPAANASLMDAKYKVLEPLGIYGPPPCPRVVCSAAAYSAGKAFVEGLRRAHNGPIVAIHGTGSQAERQLPASKQVDLLRALISANTTPVLIGSPSEEPKLKRLANRVGDRAVVFAKSLAQAMGLLANVDALVAMDSGPAHLAAGLGTKTIVIVEGHKAGITTPKGEVRLLLTHLDCAFTDIAAADVLRELSNLRVAVQGLHNTATNGG